MTAGSDDVDGEKAVAMLRNVIEGIKARGQSDVGDKTLLDALVPLTDRLEQEIKNGSDAATTLAAVSATTRDAAEATKDMVARRGRASYTGERSRGSVDAGAMAVAVIVEQINQAFAKEAQA